MSNRVVSYRDLKDGKKPAVFTPRTYLNGDDSEVLGDVDPADDSPDFNRPLTEEDYSIRRGEQSLVEDGGLNPLAILGFYLQQFALARSIGERVNILYFITDTFYPETKVEVEEKDYSEYIKGFFKSRFGIEDVSLDDSRVKLHTADIENYRGDEILRAARRAYRTTIDELVKKGLISYTQVAKGGVLIEMKSGDDVDGVRMR